MGTKTIKEGIMVMFCMVSLWKSVRLIGRHYFMALAVTELQETLIKVVFGA